MSLESSARFSSRLGLLLSVLGMAIGTGNIWRFPRIAASNSGDAGGGAFLVAWVIFLFAWSIPLIIAEYALGYRSRKGVVGAMVQMAGKRYAWMGAFLAFVTAAITFYYSVVAGWCMYYFLKMVTGGMPISVESSRHVWDSFQAGGFPLLFHALAIGLACLAAWKGVRSIERANKVLVPTLLAIVLIALVRTLTLDGAWEGVRFLFTPDWPTLAQPRLWLEALTQNAWDTGAGWGLVLTYAAYMHARHGVVKNAFITAVGNNTVSILAAIIIFGTAFAILGSSMSQPEVLEVMQTSGPAATGLTFIWMPQLFAEMPAGSAFATLFFLGLSCAALSSLISMVNLVTRIGVDFGIRRSHATAGVFVLSFVLGIPSAIYLGFFENQDFVWGVSLMFCGLFVAFAVIKQGARPFRRAAIDGIAGDWNAGRIWDFVVSVGVPVMGSILLAWWLWISATEYAPDTWFDPTERFSVMTCLLQWGIVMGLLMLFNRRMVRQIA